MENHIISDSSPLINANDDMSTMDPEDSILSMAGRPRRHDDEDDGSEGLEDDDAESLTSVPAGERRKGHHKVEEEKELPPHACA